MTAASPGVVSMFLGNTYYATEEEFLWAVADAMKPEYEAIIDAGFVLQLDCPDLAMTRHREFAESPLEDFRRLRRACTSKCSMRRSRTCRPSACACTSAGATTRGRTIATCRSRRSST